MKSDRLLRLAYGAGVCLVVWLGWSGYSYWRDHYASIDFPKITRHPGLNSWRGRHISVVPHFNPKSQEPFQVDLRSNNLSAYDLRARWSDLLFATFDTATRWPAADKMSPDFDPARVLELGKNPGLGVRGLHAQGITGRGVGVAIIDQVLPTQHPEYADRLRLYEEAGDIYPPFNRTDMHGAVVSSLAVGRTIGVAPAADLYYLATHDGLNSPGGLWRRFTTKPGQKLPLDFRFRAGGVRRILAINRQLPPERKIRVLAMAIGWSPRDLGYDDIKAATEEAKAAGLLVICSSIENLHGFKFHGFGRAPLADPEDFASYEPGLFWAADFRQHPATIKDRLLVPMDSRTGAGFTRAADYAYFRQGGWSWAIPYIAGTYALAAQVKPAVTPDEFWALAMKTGRTIELKHDGSTIPFGPILDPVALIRALQAK